MIVNHFAFAGNPAPVSGTEKPAITVLVFNYAGVDDKKLKLAQDIAGKVYRNAGIEMKWLCGPTTDEARAAYSASPPSLGMGYLILNIKSAIPAQWSKHKEVCGVAYLSAASQFAKIADIWFERVEKLTWEKLSGSSQGIFRSQISVNVLTGLTLGIVMAHELGHLLLGTNSHSRRGIMRPGWDRQNLQDAYTGVQSFMPEQVGKVRANVLARKSGEAPLTAE